MHEDNFEDFKMDSREEINFNVSVGAEAIPMTQITSLSNIWLPSHLLTSRVESIQTRTNPGIFHTLEEPVTDCFSVYSDSELENHSSPEDNSSDEFSHADILDILNNSATSAADYVNESSKNENCILYSKPSNQLQNRSYQRSSISDLSDINTIIDSREKESPVHEETDLLVKNGKQCNSSNTSITLVKYPSDSLKDSLEEIYHSEDEVNYDSYRVNQGETQNDAGLYSISDQSSNLSQQFERIEIESQTNVCETEQLRSSECGNHRPVVKHPDFVKNTEFDSYFNADELNLKPDETQDSCIDNLVEYPIAYKKKSVIEEAVGKQKNQRERKKKAPKKNILLDVSEPDNVYNEPLVDEFYEHVMSKKEHKSYTSEYPSLHTESQQCAIEEMYPSEEQTPERFWEDHSMVTNTDGIPSNSNELKVKEVKTSELQEEKIFHTIAIENIPLDVTEEQFQNFILGYGDLKCFSLKQHGEVLRAEVKMNFTWDVDWIIECLHGSQPFETTSAVIECYKLC